MTDKEQSQKAKVFAEYWKNKGYEKAFSAIKYNKIRKNPIRTTLSSKVCNFFKIFIIGGKNLSHRLFFSLVKKCVIFCFLGFT